jgi:hypothetical protein
MRMPIRVRLRRSWRGDIIIGMKFIKILIFPLFLNLFSVVESNSKIVMIDNQFPECPDEENIFYDIEPSEAFFDFDFESLKSWNNCRGWFVMNSYFTKLSRATSEKLPHNQDGLVMLFSDFKDGLPSGRSTAYIGNELLEKDVIGRSDEESGEAILKALSTPHIYMGYLKEGLPEGEGRLTYTGGFLDFFPKSIEGTWKQGCIDWDQKVTFESPILFFEITPSLFSKERTITVENYDDSTEEEISEEINRYLTECVPGLRKRIY